MGGTAIIVVVIAFVLPEDMLQGAPQPAQEVAVRPGQPAVGSVPTLDVDDPDAADDVVAEPAGPEVADSADGTGDTDGLEELAVDEGTAAPVVEPPQIPSGTVIEVPQEQRRWIQHVVVPVERLEQIAYRYGVRPEALRMQNGLKADAQELANGSTLRVKARKIPPTRIRYQYVVQPGDSWWKIGTRFGVDSFDLRSENWGEHGGRLRVGQRIEMWLDPVLFEWIAVEEDPDDPTVIRPGAASIGLPHSGRLINGVQIPDAEYYNKKYPTSSFGTTHAVTHLMEGLARFEARCRYERKLWIAQMSRKHGGPLKGHRSHQTGRDVDIRLPLREDVPPEFSIRADRVDWTATWHLISAFLETDEVSVIFLDYEMQEHVYKAAKKLGSTKDELRRYLQFPTGRKAGGFVRDSPGHDAHIHIRFQCGPHEPECFQTEKDVEDAGD